MAVRPPPRTGSAVTVALEWEDGTIVRRTALVSRGTPIQITPAMAARDAETDPDTGTIVVPAREASDAVTIPNVILTITLDPTADRIRPPGDARSNATTITIENATEGDGVGQYRRTK